MKASLGHSFEVGLAIQSHKAGPQRTIAEEGLTLPKSSLNILEINQISSPTGLNIFN